MSDEQARASVDPPRVVRVPQVTSRDVTTPDAVNYPLADFPWEPWLLVGVGRELTQAQAAAYADWLNDAEAGRLAVILVVLAEAGASVAGLAEQPEGLLQLGTWIQDWFPLVAAPLVKQGFIHDDSSDRLGHAWAAWGPPLSNYSGSSDALLNSLAHDLAFVVADCARATRPGLRWQPVLDPSRQDFFATIDPGPPVFDLVAKVKDFLVQSVACPRGARGRELRRWYSRSLYDCYRQAATGLAPGPEADALPDPRSRLYGRYRLTRPTRFDPQASPQLVAMVGAFRQAGWFEGSKLTDADLARAAQTAWRHFEREDIPSDPDEMRWRLLLLDTSRTWSEDVDAGSRPQDHLHLQTLYAIDRIMGKGVGHPADAEEDWATRPGDLLLSFVWGRSRDRRQLLIPSPDSYLSPALFTGLNRLLPGGRQRLWFFDHAPTMGIVTRATVAERDALERSTGLRLDQDPPRWWVSFASLPPPPEGAGPTSRLGRGHPRHPASGGQSANAKSSPRRAAGLRPPATAHADESPPLPGVATAQEVFEHLMRDRVAPALRDLGLKGAFRSFTYRIGDLEGAVWTRKSRYSRKAWVDFTLELGAAYLPTGAGYWNRELPSLIPGNRDYWWRVEAGRPAEPIASTILSAFRSYGWPAILAALDSWYYPPDPAILGTRTFPPETSTAARQAARLTLDPIAPLLRPAGRNHDEAFAALSDEDPRTRELAMGIVGVEAADDPRALPALLNRLEHDPSAGVRRMAALRLRPLTQREGVRPALQAAAAEDEDLEVRWQARYALRLARPAASGTA